MKALVFIAIIFLVGCAPKIVSTPSGLQYRIVQKGSGAAAKAGDEVFIYETTSYRNGTVLYSNYDSTSPVRVLIGGNQATQAVDEGLRGMREGEIRELTCPPYLVKRKGYPPNVSPDSTLVIKIRLDRIVAK
ncbi:FKBP-type peptidyl-prolyl cis-trans isomerase [Flavobacterium sp. DGU11]|uniref:Peptidyl-prolyl cis-trans isomerase n=1 Tax=Flavobacterium arundinis TaxID=3139143 RepID=A0ABU9I032_9FLAO